MITKEQIEVDDKLFEIARKGISGSFISFSNSKIEREDTENYSQIEHAKAGYCHTCRINARTTEEILKCPRCEQKLEIEDNGWKLKKNILEVENFLGEEYKLLIVENPLKYYKKNIDGSKDKFLLFSPHSNKDFHFLDQVAAFIEIPLEELRKDNIPRIIERAKEKRTRNLNWKKLDTSNREFQKLIYRLTYLDKNFRNKTSGGSGAERGNDGTTYFLNGARPREVMIQCKRNTSSSLNRKDINNYVRDAKNNGKEALLVAALNVSGPTMNIQSNDGFETSDVYPVIIWQEEEIKNRLSSHPHIIREFFY